MYRHSPVRTQRSKGIKIKHVLQIGLLIAVCFWLIFQIKRSHDKKKEFNAGDTKIQSSTQRSEEIVKLGRKDLLPKVEETSKEIKKHEQEEEEDDEHEEEEDKVEDEKDDDVDENEQDDDNTLDEDKEREESDENENEEKDGQSESQSQTENESSSDVHDQGVVARNTHEAREEHYKADDASSAVTHENGTLDNSVENIEMGISEHDNRVEEIKTGQESAIDVKEKDGEKPGNKASSNTTKIQETGPENGPPSSTTVIVSDSAQATNITEGFTILNSSIASSHGETQNKEQKSANSTNISEVVDSQTFTKSTSEENGSGSLQTEGHNVMEGTQETSDSSETENPQKVQHESIDSTDLEGTEDGIREDTAVE